MNPRARCDWNICIGNQRLGRYMVRACASKMHEPESATFIKSVTSKAFSLFLLTEVNLTGAPGQGWGSSSLYRELWPFSRFLDQSSRFLDESTSVKPA